MLAWVPGDRVVFTGDILFVGGHPAVWAGPVANWIAACDLILSWDVETVVPGHGPVCGKDGVRALRNYLEFLAVESRKRYDAGMTDEEAARDISFDAFRDWIDGERMKKWNAVHRIIHEDQPYTFLLNRQANVFIDSRVKNMRASRKGRGARW